MTTIAMQASKPAIQLAIQPATRKKIMLQSLYIVKGNRRNKN
jgi:hypothetical protein